MEAQHKPPHTTAQRYAALQRAFLTRRGTLAVYEAAGVKPPCILAFTFLGRVKQFYKRAGIAWPWDH